VIGADARRVGVIVERDEIRAPEQDDLGLRGQHHADRRLQGLGPSAGRTERRDRPVEGAHHRTQLASVGEEAHIS
jgi:hypothetical protein